MAIQDKRHVRYIKVIKRERGQRYKACIELELCKMDKHKEDKQSNEAKGLRRLDIQLYEL